MTAPQTTDKSMLPLCDEQLASCSSELGGYGDQLLSDLGANLDARQINAVHAQIAWARCGAMALTGKPSGPPLTTPAPLAACLQGAYDALQTLAISPLPMDVTPLLAERAAIFNYQRQGDKSPGGSCRLLQAADGYIAINLPREEDWQLIPALLQGAEARDWTALQAQLKQHGVAELCSQGTLLGLAITPLTGEPCQRGWFDITATGPQACRVQTRPPLVVDLSSLWAGPLCSHMLQQAGAQVIKVESIDRPDGARYGPAAFFNLLNAGKQSVALDLRKADGISQLKALIEQADIVIEGSRPRALQNMGIDAEQLVGEKPGLTWISITGFGRTAETALRIAYGDDAGVAAGLSAQLYREYGVPLICGDAVGDPLAGVHAAVAAMAGWRSGRSCLFDIALHAVLHNCTNAAILAIGDIRQYDEQWFLCLADKEIAVLPPRARPVVAEAKSLGADTQAIFHQLGVSC